MIAHRPLKVDIEFDRWSADGQIVGAQNCGDFLPKCTTLVEIDLILVMFQTNSELGVTMTGAVTIALSHPFTTIAIDIMSSDIVKFFEADFKDPLGSGTTVDSLS